MIDSNGFRTNIGIIIANSEDKLFFAKRKGQQAWQFPQGGVNLGETERDTLLRELKEEIGTNEVTIINVSRKRTRYHYPKKMLKILHKKSEWRPFSGQQQKWFLLKLNCDTKNICFKHHPIEFEAFQWFYPREGLQKVVPWKRKAYRKGLKSLGIL